MKEKVMKTFKGMLSSVDFETNEMTFEINGEIIGKYGEYVVVESKDFDTLQSEKAELVEMLDEAKV